MGINVMTPYILMIVIHMTIGGPVVIMQEFSNINTCTEAAAKIHEKIKSVETECIRK